jgi:hypothetical protein
MRLSDEIRSGAGAKKEAFRRGVEGFFVSQGLSWSRGPKTKRSVRGNHFAGDSTRSARIAYFFLAGFLAGAFLAGFLVVAFFAMALLPPFFQRNLRPVKKRVNKFF